jgi:hypothetical protein
MARRPEGGQRPYRRPRHPAGSAEGYQAGSITFERCSTLYMAAHEAGWRNAKHRQQWHNTLATYAHPVIGALPVDAIDTAHIMPILSPIWTEENETASRVPGADRKNSGLGKGQKPPHRREPGTLGRASRTPAPRTLQGPQGRKSPRTAVGEDPGIHERTACARGAGRKPPGIHNPDCSPQRRVPRHAVGRRDCW